MNALAAHFRTQWTGTLALFLVLAGGTAWAAVGLGKGEVKSRHIANGAVKSVDLAGNAVTSPKVANGSLLSEDFAAGQLPQGPIGAQGPQGIQGIPGAPGTPGQDGQQGPPGATFATTLMNATTPPATFESSTGQTSFNLPAAGKAFVTASFQRTATEGVLINCTPDSNGDVGIYIDGVPVTGTGRETADNVQEPYNASGVTGPLSAGSHNVTVGFACDGANDVSSVGLFGDSSLTVVLVGS